MLMTFEQLRRRRKIVGFFGSGNAKKDQRAMQQKVRRNVETARIAKAMKAAEVKDAKKKGK